MRALWLGKEWPTHGNSVTERGADSQPMMVLGKRLGEKADVRHIVGEVDGISGKHGVSALTARCLAVPSQSAARAWLINLLLRSTDYAVVWRNSVAPEPAGGGK